MVDFCVRVRFIIFVGEVSSKDFYVIGIFILIIEFRFGSFKGKRRICGSRDYVSWLLRYEEYFILF